MTDNKNRSEIARFLATIAVLAIIATFTISKSRQSAPDPYSGATTQGIEVSMVGLEHASLDGLWNDTMWQLSHR